MNKIYMNLPQKREYKSYLANVFSRPFADAKNEKRREREKKMRRKRKII